MTPAPQGAPAFLDALLAPLPPGEPAADAASFRAELARDQARADRRRWRQARAAVNGWNHLLLGCRAVRITDPKPEWRQREDIAETKLRAAIAAMMALPAPTRADLRWKRKWLRPFGGRANRDFLASIAADAARLGDAAE